ncbi:PP2C family protein-serine/threonine phosphatase [Kineococcus rhizosphaerae]|uniref:HAMP domain-containing protein n=1 Tax=Kineococcus rhizosphaerae TaxID=559628 RepID=A0A2T0R0W6_9ACTN|nr:PP2C family protein-serine/threonine phosphatase [Kineococcus rhizosphaerae]PRY12975.1 HAMP domain-containing protein [Kineococcus rhizosphaerae]
MADLVAVTSAWHRLMTRTSLQRRVSVMGGAFLVIVLVLTVLLLGSALRGAQNEAAETSSAAGRLVEQVDALQRTMVEAQSTHQLYITASTLDRLRTQGAARRELLQKYDDTRAVLVAAAGREENPVVRQELEVVLADAADWRAQVDAQGDYKQRADAQGLSDSIADEPAAAAFLTFYRDLDPLHTTLRTLQDRERDQAVAERNRAREIQFVVAAVSLLLVPAVLYLVRRWVIHPLGSLSEQLLRVGGGDLQTPVSLPGPPELAAVAASAETMRRRILDELADAVSAREALQQGQPLVAEVRDQLTAHDLPVVPGWSSAAALRPAEGLLAGDWYDVLPLKDGRFAVVVADVSGHGARAGIVAIQLKRLLEAALHLAPEPDLALAMAARVFSDEAERFASCVVVVVDPDSGTVTYANAGHPAPLVLRADDGDGVRVVTELEPTGPLLSWLHLDEPGSWRTRTASLAPGSLLVVFTDGLTEARPTGSTDELGIAGVLKALGRLPELTPQALVDEALDVARRHSGGRARDDVTLVAFSRGQGPARVVPSMRDGASETLG